MSASGSPRARGRIRGWGRGSAAAGRKEGGGMPVPLSFTRARSCHGMRKPLTCEGRALSFPMRSPMLASAGVRRAQSALPMREVHGARVCEGAPSGKMEAAQAGDAS